MTFAADNIRGIVKSRLADISAFPNHQPTSAGIEAMIKPDSINIQRSDQLKLKGTYKPLMVTLTQGCTARGQVYSPVR